MGTTKYSRNRRGVCSVHYQCPSCRSALRSPLEEAGTEDHCPDCKRSFKVPGTTDIAKVRAELEREAKEREKKQAQKRQQRAETLDKAKSFVGDAVNRVFDDTEKEERIGINDKLIIGRSAAKADCLVPDPQVAENHCGIFWQDSGLNLIDIGSRIGTILNLSLIHI